MFSEGLWPSTMRSIRCTLLPLTLALATTFCASRATTPSGGEQPTVPPRTERAKAPPPIVTKISGPLRFGRSFATDCELGTSVAFAPDSHDDVLVLRDGTLEKWRPGSATLVSEMRLSLPPMAPKAVSLTDSKFAFTPDGRLLIAASGSGQIVWSTTTPKPIATLFDPREAQSNDTAVSADGDLVAFSEDVTATNELNTVLVRVTIRRLPDLTKASAFEWTASGGQVALLFVDSELLITTDFFFRGLHFFDGFTGTQLKFVERKNHDRSGWPPALASVGSSLAVSGPQTVCVFDVAEPVGLRLAVTKRLCMSSPQLVMIEMSRDGRLVVGVDERGRIHLWDLRNPEQHLITASVVEPPYGDANVHEEERGGRLIDLAISADGARLATIGHCGTFGMMWTIE